MSIPQVGRDETPEFLLSGSIPKEKPIHMTFVVHIFGEEVDANCVLS